MKARKIDHVGIVIADLEKAKWVFGELLGMEFDHEEVMDAWNVKAAFFRCGESLIELLQPIGPGIDQDFLDRTGGGLHHICYEVDSIDQAYQELSQHMRITSDGPLPGNGGSRIFFLEPEDIFHIETEFMEPKRESD